MAITVGTIIRARRKEIGMTQEELAKKLGYKSKVSINKIEMGERKIPSDKVGLVADALGISPDYIYQWGKRDDLIEEKADTPEARNRRLIAYWLKIATPEQIEMMANMVRLMGVKEQTLD